MDRAAKRSNASRAWRAQFRHEVRLFVYAPRTFLFQFGFLLFLYVGIFLVADYYDSDFASIDLLTLFLPWVALILVPAFAMHAWSDAYSDKSSELISSLPIKSGQVVAGKFLAGYAMLALTLLGTASFVITNYYLGSPDGGAIFAGYLASLLLFGLYYAVALAVAALAREPIAAFVGTLFVLLLLSLPGWDAFSRELGDLIDSRVLRMLAVLSPQPHFDNLAAGFIQSNDVLYFILTTLLFLALSSRLVDLILSGSVGMTPLAKALLLAVGGLLLITLAVDSRVLKLAAVDVTESGHYSLSNGVKSLVRRSDAAIAVEFYWSESQPNIPAAIRSNARQVQRVLRQLSHLGGAGFRVESIDPVVDSDAEIRALQNQIRRIPMSSGDSFFLGAVLQSGGRRHFLPYFDHRRANLLEYDIAVALRGLTREKIPTLGILSPLLAPSALREGRAGFSFLQEFKQNFNLHIIPYFDDHLPSGLDALLVIQAPVIKKTMLYDIDQYVMRGGSLVVLIDPHVRIDEGVNQFGFEPGPAIDDLSDLLARYGITYRGNSILGDAKLAATVAHTQARQLSYPYWLRLPAAQMNRAHPATSGVQNLVFTETGSFELDPAATPLLWSSEQSNVIDVTAYTDREPQELALNFEPDGAVRMIAAAARHPLPSAFDANGNNHLAASHSAASVIAIADSDWIHDSFAFRNTDSPDLPNDNLPFLIGLAEYAAGGSLLGTIVTRKPIERSFTRVAELFKASEQAYRNEEAELHHKAEQLQEYLDRVVEVAGVDNIDQLDVDLYQQAVSLRSEILAARKQLRQIRRRIRERIDRLGQAIIGLNLLAIAMMVLMLPTLARVFRRRATISAPR